MAVQQAGREERIHSSTSPEVSRQYSENRRELSSLKAGESMNIGQRRWTKGDNGKIYYNSQGAEDETFGCVSDPAWYVRNPGTGAFTKVQERLNGLSLNATYFVSEDNKVFDSKGKQVQPDRNGVYTLRNDKTNRDEYITRNEEGEFRSCSRNGALSGDLWSELTNNSADTAAEREVDIHISTSSEVKEQFSDGKETIMNLKPGQSVLIGDRKWSCGDDNRIYYNSQGSQDETFGCISDPAWYVRNPGTGEFTKVEQKLNGLSLNATYFVSEDSKVFDSKGREVLPDRNGVYTLPNEQTKRDEYIIRDPNGDFRRYDPAQGEESPISVAANGPGTTQAENQIEIPNKVKPDYPIDVHKKQNPELFELLKQAKEAGLNVSITRDQKVITISIIDSKGNEIDNVSVASLDTVMNPQSWQKPLAEKLSAALDSGQAPDAVPVEATDEAGPSLIDPTTSALVIAQYRKNQEQLDNLKVGESLDIPLENGGVLGARTWVRGEDGSLYYNSQGYQDRTFGCLSDSDYYIPKDPAQPQDFIRVERHGSPTKPSEAAFFTDGDANVYNELGVGVSPNGNGVYRLPNPRTNEWNYIRKESNGRFVRCDSQGEQPGLPPIPESTTSSTQPDVVSDDIHRAEPSLESRRHSHRQGLVAYNTLENREGEALVDASRFMSDEARQALAEYSGASDRATGIRFSETRDNGYSYAFTRNGETWHVSQSPFYRDQYPNGQTFLGSRCVIWKAGSEGQAQREFRTQEVFSYEGKIDFNKVDALMNEAEANQTSQLLNRTNIQELDLRGESVGYIGLVSAGQDPIIDGLRRDVGTFPRMMNDIENDGQPGYDFRVQNGSEAISVDSDPVEILRKHLTEMREGGISTFYLNFAGHGNDQGVHFSTPSGHHVLSGEDVTALFDEFSDCRFIVDTVACHGAGFADAMEEYQDRNRVGDSPRVVVKLQSKPDSVNQEGRLESAAGIPEVFSSYYNIFNTYYLQRGFSVGRAHLLADQAAKRYSPCDAEVWVSTERGGNVTKGLDDFVLP